MRLANAASKKEALPDNGLTSVEALIRFLDSGKSVTYLYFWRHSPAPDGTISKNCLSNWYPAPFAVSGVWYATAEHFMMAEKARLFGDAAMVEAILRAPTPEAAKALGRKVAGFNDATWNAQRLEIVVAGATAKFTQHPELRKFLLRTGDAVLVEASPYDAVWGIGMQEQDAGAENPRAWKGLNLLGFALMEARRRVRG